MTVNKTLQHYCLRSSAQKNGFIRRLGSAFKIAIGKKPDGSGKKSFSTSNHVDEKRKVGFATAAATGPGIQ